MPPLDPPAQSPATTLDGVAGTEIWRLERWVLESLRQRGEGIFKTVDRYRGQFRESGAMRKGFQGPALFITMIGTRGVANTSGGTTAVDVEFGAVVVAKNNGAENIPTVEEKDRYGAALLLSSVLMRILMTLEPARLTMEQRNAGVPRKPWKRAGDIQFQNVYTEAVDKMGLSLVEFRWVHTLHVADLNMLELSELRTVYGESFPPNATDDTVPVTGEVDFTP